MSEKLTKSERICSQKRIDTLFTRGRRGEVAPLRYCWLMSDRVVDRMADGVGGSAVSVADGALGYSDAPVAILVSVPKKVFKRAWRRNLVKRRIRESYRRQKHALSEKIAALETRRLGIAFVFAPSVSKGEKAEIPDYKTIDDAVGKILEQILARV